MNKKVLRGRLFKHLDGFATIPVAQILNKKGVIDYISKKQSASLSEINDAFKSNKGYLNVALRILCSQGILSRKASESEIEYSITEKGKAVIPFFKLYEELVPLLDFTSVKDPYIFEEKHFKLLKKLFVKFENNFGVAENQLAIYNEHIRPHIEGILVSPLLVHLGMKGMFHKYFMEKSFRPEEFHPKPEGFKNSLDFFCYLGWFNSKNGNYEFTDEGLFFAQRASAYGVTVSYSPTFNKLEELIFGDPTILSMKSSDSAELHVDREMNVWGSGGAHAAYFKVIDDVVIDIFNQPIEKQPKGILDMGCGNGAFLIHLFDLIEQKTLRGKILDEHPLFLVGVDYNQAALQVTRANLIQADIWAKVIWGDIGKPDVLAKDLKENYDINLSNLLNVRTFLDHNRVWETPKKIDKNRKTNNSGAYASKGKYLSNEVVEDNLLEHLNKWKPYVEQFGLLLIELHTIKPELAAESIGKTAVTAYDATHGFSDQYIIEIENFLKICNEAGLMSDKEVFKKFPDKPYATVSINLLKENVNVEV